MMHKAILLIITIIRKDLLTDLYLREIFEGINQDHRLVSY